MRGGGENEKGTGRERGKGGWGGGTEVRNWEI